MERWAELRREHFVRGVPIKELVRRTGLARNTVRAALRSGEPPVFCVPERPSKLEPFKDEICRLLREDPKLPGVRVRELIEPLGFDGGKTILDDYLREVRPMFKRQRTHQRTVHRPGEICQWELWQTSRPVPVGHGQERHARVVVACLGYSRAGALIFSKEAPDVLWGMTRCLSVDPGRHRYASMIALEVFGDAPAMTAVAERLLELDGASRVRIEAVSAEGRSLVLARVSHDATDAILAELRALGIARGDVTLMRIEELGGDQTGAETTTLIWADVLGLAGSNARLISRYLALMAVAGVIACYGVVDANPILIVGAMAVSPDLLPITATAVGLIGRSLRLTAKALLTLIVGMAIAVVFAALFAYAQDQLSLLPSGFNVDETVLRSLASINDETVAVAFVAGIAAMLAFETRASSGVGVAISVTTIPAAAYLGVAAGLGEASKALGSLEVLATNVVMIVAGASVTLGLQRAMARSRDPDQVTANDPQRGT